MTEKRVVCECEGCSGSKSPGPNPFYQNGKVWHYRGMCLNTGTTPVVILGKKFVFCGECARAREGEQGVNVYRQGPHGLSDLQVTQKEAEDMVG